MLQEVLRYQNISDNYSVKSEIHLTFCLQRDLQWSFRASLTGLRFVKVHILLVLLEFFSSENKFFSLSHPPFNNRALNCMN